ncbi:ORF6N domain-containing protein [Butyrivibrio sp. INlla14]|uniref:ORF6N domain-containing protein n=1 Tax=Butyrivibrio sp. INlla14 TaxID=1520808 RepID=UPI001FA77A57|nr:ORF6N domain-containing protein [Butyrivibrio sp. INlla14]
MGNTELITIEGIKRKVYTIRGQQVMLDSDLAEIYGYEVKNLNRQVKNNAERFPEDFMFQISKGELENLRCKNFTANLNSKSRSLPYVFTEQGIYMLATVLRGELANQQSIFIMRAFREMRHFIQQNKQFVTRSEMTMLSAKVSEIAVQTADNKDRQVKTESDIKDIRKQIDTLSENFISEKDLKNYVIYKDHKFEADAAYIDIYSQAKKTILVIDDYVNTKTLQLISHKASGVDVILFTENKRGRNGVLTSAEVTDFISQYGNLTVKPNPDCHDRLVVLDYGTKHEKMFHCGHSSKDAGSKACAIIEFAMTDLFHPLIDSYMQLPDKAL